MFKHLKLSELGWSNFFTSNQCHFKPYENFNRSKKKKKYWKLIAHKEDIENQRSRKHSFYSCTQKKIFYKKFSLYTNLCCFKSVNQSIYLLINCTWKTKLYCNQSSKFDWRTDWSIAPELLTQRIDVQ